MNRTRLIAAFALVACRPPAADHGAQHIAGTAALVAPIAGANLQIVRLDKNRGEVIGTGVTDENGNFDIELADTEGTVLVELLGTSEGTSKDPLTQRELSLSLTDRFSTIVTGLELSKSRTGIVISPWSTLVAARVEWDVAYNQRSYDEAVASSMQLFAQHFGDRAFIDSSAPLDPTVASTNGLSTNALHGFVTTALSAMGVDLSKRLQLTPSGLITTISLTQWLADDLRADGTFNGVGTKGRINVLDDQYVDPEFTRSLLGAALGSFMTSAENKSGVGLSDMTAIITAISTDTSVLYGTASVLGSSSSGPGPRIVVTSPTNGGEYREQTSIIGTAESPAGVAGVELALDGQPIGNGGQRVSTTKIIWALTAPLDDGFHTLRIDSRDAHGETSSLTVAFSSDKTPPVILFGSCKAPDDRTRTVKSDFTNGDVKWWPPMFDAGCTATALAETRDDDVIVLHQYAELTKSRATSTGVNLVPEDRGQVASAPHEIAMRAAIFRKGKQLGTEATVPADGVTTSVRHLAISSEMFGDALLDVSADDVLELRVVVIDRLGNESTSVYRFKLDLLPVPLATYDYTPSLSAAQKITSYSFAGGNAQQAFDTSISRPFGLYVAAKIGVRNVSDRPTVFRLQAPPATVMASIVEWQGVVAGENTSWGLPNGLSYSTMTTCAQTQGQLTNPTPPPLYSSCYNEGSDSLPSQAAVPSNPWILLRRGGQETCVRANDYPLSEPMGALPTASAPWRIVVVDVATNVPLVQAATGEYTLAADQKAHVLVGFDVPAFEPRAVPTCSPTYIGAPSVLSSAVDPHRSAMSTLVGIIPSRTVYTGDVTWQGNAYVDCSGMTCSGDDCRTNMDNQALLRVQGTVFYEDTFIGAGGCYWQRKATRRAANISLSRLRFTTGFSVGGSLALTSSARLPKNPTQHDNALDLPVESFAIQHNSLNDNAPPDHAIRYTKGTLP